MINEQENYREDSYRWFRSGIDKERAAEYNRTFFPDGNWFVGRYSYNLNNVGPQVTSPERLEHLNRSRKRRFQKAFCIALASATAALGLCFSFQAVYLTGHRNRQIDARHDALAQSRLWTEATGTQPIPANGDVVDKLALAIKSDVIQDLGKYGTGIHSAPVPEGIATANAANNTFPGVSEALGYCVFDGADETTTAAFRINGDWCADYGQFSNKFKTQVEDITSGNLYAHLVIPKVTYHPWAHPSDAEWFLWWVLISTIAYVIALISDDEWRGKHTESYREALSKWPNLWELHLWFENISPVAFAVSVVQNGHMALTVPFIDHRVNMKKRRRIAQMEQTLLSEHPRPELLVEAKAILEELKNLNSDDQDVSRAVTLAENTVREIEEIPAMIKRDEDRMKATELLQRLAPVRADAKMTTEEHKALVSKMEPLLRKELNTPVVRPDKVIKAPTVFTANSYTSDPQQLIDSLMSDLDRVENNNGLR